MLEIGGAWWEKFVHFSRLLNWGWRPGNPKWKLARKGRDSGFAGVTVNLRGQSVDSAMVVGQVVQPRKPRLAELKGLTHDVFSERWANLF